MSQRTRTAGLLLVILIFAVSVGNYIITVAPGLFRNELWMGDFRVFHGAARLLVIHQDPYNSNLAHEAVKCEYCQYIYPPTLATLMMPLAMLSDIDAQRIWWFLNQLMFVGVIVLALNSLQKRIPVWMTLLSIALMAGFYSVYTNYLLGNIGLLLAFLLTLAFWLWQHDRRLMAGICIGLSISFKLYPAVLLLYFLWKKEYKLVFYSIVSTIVCLILPDVLLGTNHLMTYVSSFSMVIPRMNIASAAWVDNQSLNGFLLRLRVYITQTSDTPEYMRFISIALVGLLGVIAMNIYRRTLPDEPELRIIEFSTVLYLIPLALPISWSFYYQWGILAVPATIYLISSAIRHASIRFAWMIAVLAAISFAFLSQPYRIPRLLGFNVQVDSLQLSLVGIFMQSLMVYGVVITVAVLLMLLHSSTRVVTSPKP